MAPFQARRSPSPAQPQQPLNKREVRRHRLMDRVQELSDTFNRNRDPYWRSQLHSLQIDMGLILKADPYEPHPLEDMGDAITDMVEQTFREVPRGNAPGFELSPIAGKYYAKYVEAINNAQEERDARLTQLMNDHKRRMEFLEFEAKWKTEAAVEEHKELANTVRERLMAALSQKRHRLLKEKGHLDIADASAFLLHPSQFSYTNPSSPGGSRGNRNTRHGGRHLRDVDELGGVAAADSAYRRGKRKVEMEEENDSVDHSHKKGKDGQSKGSRYHGAPLFSIDKLFQDKELMMVSARASEVALETVRRERDHVEGGLASVNRHHVDDHETGGSGNGTTHEGEDDEATPAAVDMDRTANHSYHATRSARPSGPQALQILGDMPEGLPSNFRTSSFTITATNQRTLAATEISAAAKEEREDDLTAIMLAASRLEHLGRGTAAPNTQNSNSGQDEQHVGGVAMSRHGGGSSMGSLMKRSASGAGFGNGTEGGKRSRKK
ncbi:MAG: hypothetical protein M1834_007165 [Cirrosporium novae-zelandiae]|nr:MAG: hypothetical protein M1834_007165 [Cirrosporium novae-zelandiae]